MILRRVIMIIAAALLFPEAALSLDGVQSKLLEGYGLPLRWYNVEGAPAVLEGSDPVRDDDTPRHLLKLEPGQRTAVWLPAWEILRIDSHDGPLAADGLEVSFSAGGGLFRHDAGVRSVDGKSLVFSPSSPAPLLVSIERPARHRSPLAVALYISSREPLGEIAPYRRLIPLPLDQVRVGRAGQPGDEQFWSVPEDRAVSIPVDGPVRVALDNHMVYPAQESRRSFTYRVQAALDNQAPRFLEFETGPDMEPSRHNGEDPRHILGRRQTGYLDIPAGEHTLTLKAAVPLFARLLVQDRPDYLVPQKNAPVPSVDRVEEGEFPPASSIARDNRRRDGGAVGTALMRAAGRQRPDYPAVRELAEEFAGMHTFYRDLYPDTATPSASPAFRWFIPSRLGEPDSHPSGVIAGEQHTAEMVRMLAGGTFLNAPEGSGAAYSYRLPPRFAPSLLRVAVPAEALKEGAELSLQFDDASPQRLILEPPPVLPNGSVPVSPAEAGLLLLADNHHSPAPVTMGGAFAASRPPAPLLDAAVTELVLPPQVRTVRIWKNGASKSEIPVAVQYRASGPYRLAETEFLAAENAIGYDTQYQALVKLLASDPPLGNGSASFAPLNDGGAVAGRDLESERFPLARLILSLERAYTASVAPPAKGVSMVPSGSKDVEFPARAARLAAGEGDWLTALESWSIPARSGTGAIRRDALFGQIDALTGLNEDYLAEHRFRGLFLYGDDEETRSRAMMALEQRYAATNDIDALLSLQATAFLRKPEFSLLRSLGVTLLEAGEQELALQALLVLPPVERPRGAMLQAALRLGWWQSFEKVLAEAPAAEERSLWQGLRAMGEGRYDEALDALRVGGTTGNAWARHLEEGVRIRAALMDADPVSRLLAVAGWEQWQATHPGPRVWEPETGAVAACAGAVTLTNIARDTSFPAFRATAAQPALIRLAGPVKIRVEARPLHSADSRTPLEGWLQVRDGERLYVQPITRNMPAQGLAIIGDDGHAAGLGVEREIDLGPGIHELQVSGGSLDLLVRVHAFRPAIPCPALPPVTPDTLAAAVDGLYAPIPERDTGSIPPGERIIMVPRDGGVAPHILPFTRSELLAGSVRNAVPQAPFRAEALAKLASLRPPRTSGNDEQAALLAGKGDISGLFALAAESDNPDVAGRAVQLLWVAEQDPDHYLPALSVARVLAASHGGVQGLTPLVERLSRRGNWVPVTAVASSAGLRSVEVTGWRPETPALRIRRALLPPAATNEQILADMGQMVFTMVNTSATVVELTLAADELAYLTPQPLEVSYQLDREPSRRLTLRTGDPPHTVTLTVPSGEHVVRVGIEERFAEQFLRVGLRERPARSWRGAGSYTPVLNRIERPYHVAKQKEPVRLRVEGPAVLRIDELRDGITTINYRMVAAGFQQVEIGPEPGRSEGLYRFFTHASVAEKPLMASRYVDIRQEPVPPPAVTVASPPEPAAVRLSDAFVLGRQEDGTWSGTVALVRRKPVQEGIEEDSSPEQFLEGEATYRYFNGERTYYEAGALARSREYGGPTIGVRAAVKGLPQAQAPFSWNLTGNLCLQRPDHELGESTEWAATLQGGISQMRELDPKTWHRPAISLFGRALSLSDTDKYLREEVDQDIFTRYKSDHRHGVSLSESFIHRPWLDTLWHGSLSLTTNELDEVLFPDHLSLSMGWKQLLGDFQANAFYRHSLYFPDDDRSGTMARNSIGAEFIYNRWLENLDRLELGATMNWHFETSDFTGALSLTWHFDNGRGFRDFYPGEIEFRDLRQRMIPTSRNNGLAYEPE